MKTKNILTIAALAGMSLGMATSCSEDSFLNEKLITGKSTQYLETEDGINELSIGAYQKLKFKFNYIWGINCYNMGVDEFTGGANNIVQYNAYTSLNSGETGSLQPVWDNMYGLIEPANILISNVQNNLKSGTALYNTRLGEGYFFRAYGLFELVKQFGGVPIKTSPSTSAETYFTRNSEEDCYAQIIADFEKAYELLPVEETEEGRLTKSAAAHFLAKAHLFRASELYSGWNTSYVASDLDAVIRYGKEVIAAHPLCANFAELWDFKQANGANEKVAEVVLAAQFAQDVSTWGRFGNQMHLYYPSVYQNLAGCKRDISGGREFCYVSATEYSMNVFDRVNDSRFWKSFITCYGANDTQGAPTWGDYATNNASAVPAGATSADKRFVAGEIGVKYIVNNPGDTRYTDLGTSKSWDEVLKDGKLQAPHTFVRYYSGEAASWNTSAATATGNYYGIHPHNRGVALSKFRDGYRNSIASQFGTRDAIIARSADDVLMVAEAYIRKGEGSYNDALTYLNMVRDRAGYAAGEDRSKSVDGGQSYKNNTYCNGKGGGYSADGAIYTDENTYYESNNIAVTTAESKTAMHLNTVDDVYNSQADASIYAALGCTTNAQKMMCFLLNERTRELIGESHRWEDLARTMTLEKRWNTFNDAKGYGEGTFDPARDYRRPIPQSFLDGITNAAGKSLSAEEKEAMQNPGY